MHANVIAMYINYASFCLFVNQTAVTVNSVRCVFLFLLKQTRSSTCAQTYAHLYSVRLSVCPFLPSSLSLSLSLLLSYTYTDKQTDRQTDRQTEREREREREREACEHAGLEETRYFLKNTHLIARQTELQRTTK